MVLAFGRGLAIFSMTRSQEKANIDTNALLVVWPISSPMTFRKMRSLGLAGFFFFSGCRKRAERKRGSGTILTKKINKRYWYMASNTQRWMFFFVLYFLFFSILSFNILNNKKHTKLSFPLLARPIFKPPMIKSGRECVTGKERGPISDQCILIRFVAHIPFFSCGVNA